MKNIMLDVETFGTNPYSVVIAIGAVYFDPSPYADKCIKGQFYVTIDPILSSKMGFRTDMETMCWWLDPERAMAYKDWLGTVHLEPPDAFQGFAMWLAGLFDLKSDPHAHDDLSFPPGSDRQTFEPANHIAMWGNGPAFDNEIVRNGFKILNMEPPWKHWNDRCFRTMKNLTMWESKGQGHDFKAILKASELAPPHEGFAHNALVDARQQAKWLCNIAREFDLKL